MPIEASKELFMDKSAYRYRMASWACTSVRCLIEKQFNKQKKKWWRVISVGNFGLYPEADPVENSVFSSPAGWCPLCKLV